MNRRVAGLLVGIMVGLSPILPVTPASASPGEQESPWRTGSKDVGACGETHSNYVRSVQVILFSRGLLTSSQIDAHWGPVTLSATKSWQTAHGLSADGCVGYYTWDAMQYGHDNVTVGGEHLSLAHMDNLGIVPGTNGEIQQWSYNEYAQSTGATPIRTVYYRSLSTVCWWVRNNSYFIVAQVLDEGTCSFS
jgi:hypothetical protein